LSRIFQIVEKKQLNLTSPAVLSDCPKPLQTPAQPTRTLVGATEAKRLGGSFDFEIIRKKAEIHVRQANRTR